MRRIRMNIGGVDVTGTLADSDLAAQVWNLLPCESYGETWGEEVYFPVRLEAENTDPVETVKAGDIAYWPDGPDLCIFFGKTPKSTGDDPVVASPVTVIGTFDCMREDFLLMRRERRGLLVRVERVVEKAKTPGEPAPAEPAPTAEAATPEPDEVPAPTEESPGDSDTTGQ